MARRKAPHIPDALLDQLLAGADARTAFEADGLVNGADKIGHHGAVKPSQRGCEQ